jgi:hypothetical protein
MKLIVLDFIGGNCHIFTVTKEICQSEDNVIEFLWERGFDLNNIQYMYGDIPIIGDMKVVL